MNVAPTIARDLRLVADEIDAALAELANRPSEESLERSRRALCAARLLLESVHTANLAEGMGRGS
ncbi:hypothetical protein [Lysobacter claricitrinus]|uniref:hypothetical protein n=1 Tax=Lysobacter claricitrinus TaxID=3367728 RepID=UPI0037DAC9CB